jgi:hypothetical protein
MVGSFPVLRFGDEPPLHLRLEKGDGRFVNEREAQVARVVV